MKTDATSPHHHKTKLLLVGGGHAHLYILKKLAQFKWDRVEVTLLCPSRYQYYSGMFSGYTEGLFHLEDIRADLQTLAEKGGVKWVKGFAVSIDPDRRLVDISGGDSLPYDIVSFDIGSLIRHDQVPGAENHATFIKPNYHIADRLHEIRKQDRIVVVGGGASGTEMSLSLQAWRTKHGLQTPVTLISSGRLLGEEASRISGKIENIVRKKGINLLLHAPVIRVEEGQIYINAPKRFIPFDQLLWLAGPKAPPLFKKSNLSVDERGFLLVKNTLQSMDDPRIFGAGDCVTMSDYLNLPKAGVYAVRQAKVLWHNLYHYIESGPLQPYVPQSSFLSILSTGHEQGFLMYKGLSFHGKWAWKLKKKIDTDFMKQYQVKYDGGST